MSAEITDLQQRLANLFRVGKVHSIDHAAARLRVALVVDVGVGENWDQAH